MAAPAAPLLRSPPFPGGDAAVSRSGAIDAPALPDAEEIDRLFAVIRDARVGGCFWARPVEAVGSRLIVRDGSAAENRRLFDAMGETERASAVAPADDVDPWSVLGDGVHVIAHGDDEWAALAHIAGCSVQLLSAGRYGAPEETASQVRHRVADALLGQRYRDPFTGEDADVWATIALLAEWRAILDANRTIVAACGMAWWKRPEIGRFLWTPEHRLRFFRSERRALPHAAREGGAIAVWPSRISVGMAAAARDAGVPLVRVEDGFVRSVGLGSNLVPPSSVAVDRLGIHYDPGAPSDLEAILAHAEFPPALLARADRLRATILANGISKYGGDGDRPLLPRRPGRRVVLVPGQVEDDMSVRLGGGGLASNLELLRRTRELEPDAEIWFRPHPDVDAGHRTGEVRDADALLHADRIMRGGGMAGLLGEVDAVHVLTSLTGFEALLRGRDVTCHGTPFYAGWGLTRDLAPVPDRRGRALTLAQLIAGVLILYPRYLDPVTGLPCPPEVLITRMGDGRPHNRLGWITRLRRLQGRLAAKAR
ncbi:beta-3-deoxy-D-manno-oct-2-ulosonic acid transferase [Nostoc sp. 3335mG]|nr:beta-3-deoxy-D-manno-oct-2-ulosonic acid transferase [Nostoc sp. 3335mG]